jgi:hypothetical protein
MTLAIFVIMLNVVMVGVVIPTVVAPIKRHCKKVFFCERNLIVIETNEGGIYHKTFFSSSQLYSIYTIMNMFRSIYTSMNSFHLSNLECLRSKTFETPCLTFWKCLCFPLIKIEPVSVTPEPSCASGCSPSLLYILSH